jgi:hypothetical protein
MHVVMVYGVVADQVDTEDSQAAGSHHIHQVGDSHRTDLGILGLHNASVQSLPHTASIVGCVATENSVRADL